MTTPSGPQEGTEVLQRSDLRGLKGTEPLFIKGKHSEHLALLVHGFTGTPAEMRPLATGLSERLGISVQTLCLEGHATTEEELGKVHFSRWLAQVSSAIEHAHESHPHVHLIGLSMGGLISAICGQDNRALLRSLTLLAPAVRLRGQPVNPIGRCLGRLPTLPFGIMLHRPPPTLVTHVFYKHFPLTAVQNFFRVQRRARRLGTCTTLPTLVMASLNDQTVDPMSLIIMSKKFPHSDSRAIMLSHSEHPMPIGCQGPVVTEEVARFISGFC